jgi:hypothetical protein
MNTQTQSTSQKTVREQVTQTITYQIAATIISDSEFPKMGILPTPSPAPLRALGHYVSLDYILLMKIIWHVIDEIKDAGAKIYQTIPPKSWVPIVISGILTILFTVASESPGTLFMGIVVTMIVAGISISNARYRLFLREVATIRIQSMKKLLADDWSHTAFTGYVGAKIEEELSKREIGDGTLGGEKIPVLVITHDDHPFPGYGHLQAESQFVCRPKDKGPKSRNESMDDKFKTIQDCIMSAVTNFPTAEMSCGEVLVLHGNTLAIDSAWLNDEKAPRLWLDKKVLDKCTSIDERVSVRRYFAVQLIFKDYGTVATFFVRPFMAGNSLCSQVALTTIGPHNRGSDFFQKRFLKYQEEEKKGFLPRPQVRGNTQKNKDLSESTRLIKAVKEYAEVGAIFQSTLINYATIKKLDPLELEADKEYQKEFKELVGKSTSWLGWLIDPLNWREGYSMTFTDDFFGKTEGRAAVSTLYDQICRSMLDTIDSLGYDISNYRDSEGNYSIHAERIEQLVVGEQIHVAERKIADEQKPEAPKPMPPAVPPGTR